MLIPKLANRFIMISLLAIMTSVSFSQTLYSEPNKLNALQLEQKDLIETNADIKQNLVSIKEEIIEAKLNAPSDNAYEEAQINLAATEETFAGDRSSANQAKVDNAKFKLLLAERKHKKNNKELFDLEKEQKQLSTLLASNSRRNDEISGQAESLTAIVASMQAMK
jgi:hypothetical protein